MQQSKINLCFFFDTYHYVCLHIRVHFYTYNSLLFIYYSGEQTSKASNDVLTKSAKAFGSAVYNEHTGGRKIDLMIRSSGIELSTSEWKKKGVGITTGKEQQVKNVRGNKAILKNLVSLPITDSDRENVFCLGMDFIGSVGYMFSVYHLDDAYVASFVADLSLPVDFTELEDFVTTLDNFYKFKNQHTRLQKMIDPAYRGYQETQTLSQLRINIQRTFIQ
ncbi:hypothetical protein INT45_007133 [Circinella minor]|uniref:Uncharacterized protein n=1 Tax=Circinella minor TaxID=1195481 RepID=A0A8H7S4S0_9FUNG|nr:hypothetical protein INT45_007133 [Circinella minor]